MSKKCAVCADLLFCLVNVFCFFDVFVAVAVVVATALYFDLKGRMQCHDTEKSNMYLYIKRELLVIMKIFLFC